MGIYTFEHFESKEDALKYYSDGIKHFAEKLRKLCEEDISDPKITHDMDLAVMRIQLFMDYFKSAQEYEFK